MAIPALRQAKRRIVLFKAEIIRTPTNSRAILKNFNVQRQVLRNAAHRFNTKAKPITKTLLEFQ